MCRPINMAFTTNTYAETRAIIDALHNSDFTNQISDISVQFEKFRQLRQCAGKPVYYVF